MDEEREKIRNSTWTCPEVDLAEPNIIVNLPTNMTSTDVGPARGFDAKKLPRYAFGKNLAEWIKLMEIIVMTYEEEKVCPSVEGDVVRDWFVSLGNTDIEYMTTRPGCWAFMESKFTEKWRASAGQLHLACDKREKEYNESYTQYALRKLNMVADAYPQANDENKILQVRLGLDPPAARYCKEFRNLQAFIEEIGHYDKQVNLEKCATARPTSKDSSNNNRDTAGGRTTPVKDLVMDVNTTTAKRRTPTDLRTIHSPSPGRPMRTKVREPTLAATGIARTTGIVILSPLRKHVARSYAQP